MGVCGQYVLMQTLFMNRIEDFMKKIFRQIHLWLSVPFGLIISLICFSGAMLVFENEVMELVRHELYYVKKVETVSLPVDRLLEEVELMLPDSVSVTGINVFSDPERAWQVNLSKPRRASVYVDPYTGEIKGKYERPAFFVTMFRLHRWLLDSMKADGGVFWGKMIVGVSTLLFVVVLISGIVIWWPRTRKALKNSLRISVGRGFRRFWYDLHVAGGMYALFFLLAMALTGLTWSFGWYRITADGHKLQCGLQHPSLVEDIFCTDTSFVSYLGVTTGVFSMKMGGTDSCFCMKGQRALCQAGQYGHCHTDGNDYLLLHE